MKRIQSLIAGCFLAVFLLGSCSSAPDTQAATGTNKEKTSNGSSPLFEWVGNKTYKSPNNVSIDAASLANQATGLTTDWYKDSTFYHIWVKSFNDYDGDGVGDFRGITAKLDYIKNDLGADAIWLSPIFDCQGKGAAESYNMHGYDTVDYYEVNGYFGNEEQVEELLREAHKRGMKVIFDFVPNHTSNNHPWFLQSAKSENSKEAWYLWNDVKLSWNPMGNSNTWYSNISRMSNYYGAFNSSMPDLNYRNYEVREEMKNVARYWLNKGFDGLRIDAARYMIEDAGTNAQSDRPPTHEFFNELRAEVVDSYAALGSPKFMVAEAWINTNRPLLESYLGTPEKKEFNMVFDFDFSGKVIMALRFKNKGVFDFQAADSVALFLSNHDNLSSRPASIYKTPAELNLATAISLLLPATPFIYYANEIGQTDAPNFGNQDIRLRYNLQWDQVAQQKANPSSTLSLHKKLLAARASYPALRRGVYQKVSVSGSTEVAAYTLTYKNETLLCVFNLSPAAQSSLFFALSSVTPESKISPVLSSGDVVAVPGKKDISIEKIDARGFAVYKIE